jgi:hypothetical protein
MTYSGQPNGKNLTNIQIPQSQDLYENVNMCMYLVAIADAQSLPMTIVGASESMAENIKRLLYRAAPDKRSDLISFTFPGLSNKQADALAAMG